MCMLTFSFFLKSFQWKPPSPIVIAVGRMPLLLGAAMAHRQAAGEGAAGANDSDVTSNIANLGGIAKD